MGATTEKMGIQPNTINKKPRVFRAKGGKRADLKMYFRSMWEANWARWLTFLVKGKAIEGWEYEPVEFEFHKIKRGNRFYKPDFKVYNNGGGVEYHEIKGYMDADSRIKLDRMKEYYPMVRVIVVDSKQYYAVAKDAKFLIKDWEAG